MNAQLEHGNHHTLIVHFALMKKEKSWGASFHRAIVAQGERTPAFFYKEKTGRLVHRVPITQVEHAPTLSLPAIGVTC